MRYLNGLLQIDIPQITRDEVLGMLPIASGLSIADQYPVEVYSGAQLRERIWSLPDVRSFISGSASPTDPFPA